MKILKNIKYFWKAHLLVFLSLAIAGGVIVASLVIGDCLDYTLTYKAENRLGKVVSSIEKIGTPANAKITKNLAKILNIKALGVANSLSKGVEIYAVDDKFWALSPDGKKPKINDGVAINKSLANAFNIKIGDEIALRFEVPETSSGNIALVDDSPIFKTTKLRVSAILTPENFADFYLYDWQNSPMNVFIDYDYFCKKFSLEKHINLILSDSDKILENLDISLASLGLNLTKQSNSNYILKAQDIFLNDEISKCFPNAQETLSWFISEIQSGNKLARNAFIIGAGQDLSENQIELNEVFAKQNNLKIGDTLDLFYYIFDKNLKLKTEKKTFSVAKISPINQNFFVKELVPEYDGLTNVDDCSNWKSSIPIDLSKINQADKDYWASYGATPKLRLSYSSAKQMFANSMGKSTALLLEDMPSDNNLANIDLKKLGFILNFPAKNAIQNAQNGVDFKSLFIGLSFFIIASALLLIALIIKMNLQDRRDELNLFKYLGVDEKIIQARFFYEFAFPIILGALFSGLMGLGLAKLSVLLLNLVWVDISDSSEIFFSYKTISILIGVVVSALLGLGLVKLFIRNIFSSKVSFNYRRKKSSILKVFALSIFVIFILAATLCFKFSIIANAILSLIVYALSVGLFIELFKYFAQYKKTFSKFDFVRIGVSSRLSKSVFIMLSLGVYLLCVVGLNKIQTPTRNSEYKYQIKTAIPAKIPEQNDFDILAFRLRDGALANCLNLNKVSKPQILGGDIDKLIEAKVISIKDKIPYSKDDEKIIPVYVDESSMIWNLKAEIGDEFEYETQIGNVKLKIVASLENSIFQGSFLIYDENFLKLWQNTEAFNLFLAAPKNDASEIALSKLFAQYLPEVNSITSILAKFDSLQNAYLKIFYQLGLIGLILGIFACIITIKNNLINEIKYLKMLNLLGLSKAMIAKLITLQYLLINISASIIGILASIPLINLNDNFSKAITILIIIAIMNLSIYPLLVKLLSNTEFGEDSV